MSCAASKANGVFIGLLLPLRENVGHHAKMEIACKWAIQTPMAILMGVFKGKMPKDVRSKFCGGNRCMSKKHAGWISPSFGCCVLTRRTRNVTHAKVGLSGLGTRKLILLRLPWAMPCASA